MRPRPAGAIPARPAAAGSGRRGGRGSAPPSPTAIASASANCPPSSMNSVSTCWSMLLAREEPRRAGEELQLGVEHRRRSSSCSRRTRPRSAPSPLALLPPAELEALLGRGLLEVVQELVDRLVAERGDADPLPGLHERDRHARAVPRLPRAGRPLDEEVAAVELSAPPRPSVPSRLARGGRRSRISTQRRVPLAVLGEAQERRRAAPSRRAARRDQRRRERLVRALHAAAERRASRARRRP